MCLYELQFTNSSTNRVSVCNLKGTAQKSNKLCLVTSYVCLANKNIELYWNDLIENIFDFLLYSISFTYRIKLIKKKEKKRSLTVFFSRKHYTYLNDYDNGYNDELFSWSNHSWSSDRFFTSTKDSINSIDLE